MALIKDRRDAPDPWLLLERGPDGAPPAIPETGDVIVPLVTWQTLREPLLARSARLGVWLAENDEPAEIADDLEHFRLVAVRFPRATDGRGYSIARLLRERHGWQGELRAIGDIQRDQLHFLAHCGFDAFDLRDGEDVQAALAAFQEFSEAYQAAVDRPLPLFRRRAAASS